nr:leishmanolysin-like peptidase [Lytechinus pictus]
MNICPDSLRQYAPEVIQQVVQHEIYHAIGVNVGMFAFFRDENGDPLTPLQENGFPEFDSSAGHFKWSERVARTKTLDWDIRGGTTQRNVTILVTPNIVREAREHFGCDSIEGVELEDDGGDGSALSHFESRIFTTESMAPQLTFGRKFSRLTLAWLEDTGWYEVDYAYADPYTWGRGLGCGFVNQSCKWWMDTQRERWEIIFF